jgi:dipeptidyl aminopeptidase/acylaminoacyl peptidase
MTTQTKSRKFGFGLVLFLMILTHPLPSQIKAPFTIDDYFSVVSMSLGDMTKDGKWLACTVSTRMDSLPRDNYRYGDPTYVSPFKNDLVVINTETGQQKKLFPEKQQLRSLIWSPDGQSLAFFLFEEGEYRLAVWHRLSGKIEKINTSEHGPIDSSSHLFWSEDGKSLHFALRTENWLQKSKERFDYATQAPIIVQDSENPFLLWDEVRRRGNLKIPASWDLKAKKLTKILPETQLLSVRLTEDGKYFIFERDVTEKTSYDVISGTSNQLEILELPAGQPRVLLEKFEGRRLRWTKDNTLLSYSEKGDVFVMGIEENKPRNLTAEEEKNPGSDSEKKEDSQKEQKQRFSILRFSPNGQQLLCSSSRPTSEEEQSIGQSSPPRQFWLIDVQTGDRRMIYEFSEDEDTSPSLQIVDWSPDGQTLFFSYSTPDRYDRGLVQMNVQTGKLTDLIRSDHLYRRWQMSDDGRFFVFTDSDGDSPDEWYVADTAFKNTIKLTDLNPQLGTKALSHTELISYRDADGRKLYGVLYYPTDYEKGQRYPLITEVYESYFDNGFNSTLNIFTSAGYAVLHPSVRFDQGYPGEAWAKGALAAVNKVIEMGIADPDRLGIQGTSYGGYATVLLITQTDRFKAAINNSGKVNMISFYTQSPRIGVRNIHAPEKSQDRIGGTMWDYPERYLAHSAILYADRIKTPLLCITGDQDPNVEALQSQEIYYALRRLGKKVVWLRYHNGAHGGPHTAEERKDMYTRMLEWYDKYLKSNAEKSNE